MAWIESSITVSKPLKDAFAFLDVADNHAKFIPHMVEFNQTSSGPFGRVGTTARGVLRYLGIRIEVPYEIVEHESNQKLAMKGKMGFIQFKDGYILSAAERGTQIKFWLELNLTGPAKFISPFGGLIGRIHAYETLHNLKREMEETG